MAVHIIGRGAKPKINRYRQVGDLTTRGYQCDIEGHARRTIAQALCFHGPLPSNFDFLVENYLPKEAELMELCSVHYDAGQYLSFTVYSLKQMVAAGTVSVGTAWSLFHQEWQTIEEVNEHNIAEHRTKFLMQVRDRAEETNLTSGQSLQRFEFWARAGEAGLAQFERYGKWAEALVFDQASCAGMEDDIKDEYRKALWLEMRLIEGQVGISGTNKDVTKFILNRANEAKFHPGKSPAVECSIDIFNQLISAQSGAAIDSAIKAEVGHWMFDRFSVDYDWVAELMDRMNMTGYTMRVAQAYDQDLSLGEISLEVLVFRFGGFYLQSELMAHRLEVEWTRGMWSTSIAAPKAAFPVGPHGFSPLRLRSTEEHEVAEFVESKIRQVIGDKIEAKDPDCDPAKAYQIYRKIGVYIALLNLKHPRSKDEIVEILDQLDLAKVEKYYRSWRVRRAWFKLSRWFYEVAQVLDSSLLNSQGRRLLSWWRSWRKD